MVSTRSSAGMTPARPTAAPAAPGPSASAVSTRSSSPGWTHAPSKLALFWLAVSLPLVTWDTGYVLLRPHSMPGGKLHWPIWAPYKLYGEIDGMYGWKQFNANNGFTSAQGLLNVVETAMYVWYVWLYLAHAKAPSSKKAAGGAKVLSGSVAGIAALVGFSAAVMTVSKTVLYWLCEYFSGFDNIGHNTVSDIILLWVIPNGAWLVFPSIMIYTMGSEIVGGLTMASGGSAKSD